MYVLKIFFFIFKFFALTYILTCFLFEWLFSCIKKKCSANLFEVLNTGKNCDSCGAVLNPPWVTDRGGRSLCTPCKLFIGDKNGSSVHRNRTVNATLMACSNCGTTTTSVWRRNSQGETVCNACGLYFKLHNINRPTSMRKVGIQRRWSRKSKNQAFIPCDDVQIISGTSTKTGKQNVGRSFQTC